MLSVLYYVCVSSVCLYAYLCNDDVTQVETIACDHDARLTVDVTRAYHFGARYNVEMEIVLPGQMTVMESHDIALALQHKIESLSDVERAFVHVDHQGRDGLEHKIERHLVTGITSPMYQIQINAPSSSAATGTTTAGASSPTSMMINDNFQLSASAISSSRNSSDRLGQPPVISVSRAISPMTTVNTPTNGDNVK